MDSRDLNLYRGADAAIRELLSDDIVTAQAQWTGANYSGLRHTLTRMRRRLDNVELALPPALAKNREEEDDHAEAVADAADQATAGVGE